LCIFNERARDQSFLNLKAQKQVMTHEVVEGTCLILRALLSYILTDSFKLSRRSLFSLKYIYIYIYIYINQKKKKRRRRRRRKKAKKRKRQSFKLLSQGIETLSKGQGGSFFCFSFACFF
jgi:hypothetical protein